MDIYSVGLLDVRVEEEEEGGGGVLAILSRSISHTGDV